jgi:hypothetical protein
VRAGRDSVRRNRRSSDAVTTGSSSEGLNLTRVSPISTVDVMSHSTCASATFKFNFSRSDSSGVLPAGALCGRWES